MYPGQWPTSGWTGQTPTRSPILSVSGRCTNHSSRPTSPGPSIHRLLRTSAFRGTSKPTPAEGKDGADVHSNHRALGRSGDGSEALVRSLKAHGAVFVGSAWKPIVGAAVADFATVVAAA